MYNTALHVLCRAGFLFLATTIRSRYTWRMITYNTFSLFLCCTILLFLAAANSSTFFSGSTKHAPRSSFTPGLAPPVTHGLIKQNRPCPKQLGEPRRKHCT